MKLNFQNAINSIIPKESLNNLRKYKSIIIFGAGQSGDWTVNMLRKNKIYPTIFCDNYKDKWGLKRKGLEILSFEKAIERYPDAGICIASMWAEDIKNQIKLYDEKLVTRTWDLLFSMAWETSEGKYISSEKEYITSNLNKFTMLYENLGDELSKYTLEGLLNYRLTRNKIYLSEIMSKEATYLDETIINLKEREKIKKGKIIDGGSFDGDTVKLFVEILGGSSCLDIDCYEPSNINCGKIKELCKKLNNHNITVHNKALWDNTDLIMSFEGGGLSGKIVDSKNNLITMCSIDSYNFSKVSFIKLDIEGAERKALEGAKKTIEKCRPILAICAYHLQDDLLVIYDFISSLNCKYKIMLRHYMCSSGDTIMYGIPI